MKKTLSLAERLRDEIEEDVVQGKLAPGTHLDEVQLASRFNVSRTPIREALTELVATGLLERRRRRGVVVASLPFDRLLEMFEVMAELEGLAARLATRRHTAADAAAIRLAHEACRTAVERSDRDNYYYENERFHRAVQTASHSGFLISQCSTLSRRLRPYRRAQLDTNNRIGGSFTEHELVVDAIFAQEAEAAHNEMRSHVLVQGERFGDLMAALRQRGDALQEVDQPGSNG